MNKPLSGCTVLVTRPIRQAPALQRLIEAEGGVVHVLPLIKTVRLPQFDEQRRILLGSSWDWVVFTSANAVSFFEEVLHENGSYLYDSIRVAAVGKKTAAMLHKKGWNPELVPDQYSAEGLADLLKTQVRAGERVLFPKSARARPVIPSALAEIGANVVELPLYTSAPAIENKQQLQEDIDEGRLDFLTFTSPSAVQAFVSFLEKITPVSSWQNIPVVSIGAITGKEVRRKGFIYHKTAQPYTIEGMVRSLTTFIKEES